MSSGFTLIELLVVIALIGVLSVSILVAYPTARAEQKLKLAEQTLQAALRGAQQAAINEERDERCVEKYEQEGLEALCSDTGVTIDTERGALVVFADTFKSNAKEYNSTDDFLIATLSFPEGVEMDPAIPFIFEGTPPTVTLWAGQREVVESELVTFRLGDAERVVQVGSYGQVEYYDN